MYEFKFPDVGEGIAEGEIRRWLVKVGQRVEAHQPLVEMETDKAVVELPSPRAGTIRELRGDVGGTVPVGAVLVVIEEDGDRKEKPKGIGVVGELEEAQEGAEAQAPEGDRPIPALPKDRKLAGELGVELKDLRPTGPRGRVTEEDIRGAAAPAASEGDRIPLRGVRRSMARSMTASAFTAVHVTVMERAEALALRNLRERERPLVEGRGLRLTYLPFIVKALTLVLEKYPILNSRLDTERQEILLHREMNIGFAVDTPEGLLVPVIRNARRMSILDLAASLQDLARRARERKISPGELKGGTFTVSNYGVLGGLWGTPIINPPEAAILGIGRIAEEAVVRQGEVVARPMVPLSLTFDHRIIDGATAHRFLNDLIQHIENPDMILLEN